MTGPHEQGAGGWGQPGTQQPYGAPPQGVPAQGYPPQGYPPQGYPQGGHPEGHPQGGYPQGYPPGYGGPQPQGYPPGYGPPPGHGAPVGWTPATMGDRLVARIIDGLVIVGAFILLMLPGIVAVGSSDAPDGELTGGAAALITLGLFAAILFALMYEITMIARKGQTIGKRARGIKVLKEYDLSVPGFRTAFLRWIIPMVAAILPAGAIIVFCSPFFDNSGKRQGWHDKAAKTVVIYA